MQTSTIKEIGEPVPVRNPVYLDLELVRNVADYYGVPYAVEALVTERGKTTTQGGGGVSAFGARLGMERTEGTEMESSYQVPATPLRIMNDVIDAVFDAGDIRQTSTQPDAGDQAVQLRKGDIVQIEGNLVLSAASEAGSILGRVFPIMAASGGAMTEEAKTEIVAGMIGRNDTQERRLYKFEGPSNENIVVPIEASYFFRQNSYDDLETEVTVFGSIERVVAEGTSVSLERWLLPDMDRAMRRMMKKQGIEGLLEGIKDMADLDVADAQALVGPALEIRPIAIY